MGLTVQIHGGPLNIRESMKVETHKKLIGLALLLAAGTLTGQPQTTELREPTAVKTVVPVVPYEMARHQIAGVVTVSFKVDSAGRPHDLRIEDASHDAYEQSVLNALRQWRFEQAASDVRYKLPFVFNSGEAN